MRTRCAIFQCQNSCQKVALAAVIFCAFAPASFAQDAGGKEAGLGQIRSYIAAGWDTLTRSMVDCKTVVDPKLAAASVLYLPADFDAPAAVQEMQKRCNVQVKHLPQVIHKLGEVDTSNLEPPGLLYLDNKYVVPGGRFNEMYGWDSYFIVRGLVEDKRVELARGMVENFFFEIEHYGAVLNANRTYYLTRSQPPFLTSMILAVYNARPTSLHTSALKEKAEAEQDRAWLARAYEYAKRDYTLWTHEPHLAGSTGLSRYYDFGSGPAPESVKDETGHYRQVAAFFLGQPDLGRGYVVSNKSGEPTVGPLFALEVCDSKNAMASEACDAAGGASLSAEYYKGDRAMRESGYDVSFRFGPHGVRTHHFAPVCLNSLLYKTEKDLELISGLLRRDEESEEWKKRAADRKERIQKYLWDSERGMYFDYDFENQTRSNYEYVTTFFPLWAGIPSQEQAKALMWHLATFEKPGGLVMSPKETGAQWDFPYAWAPDQLVADEGIRRYGFDQDADRVSYEFLSTVAENFRRDGTIREKYNAVTRSSETQVTAGYHMNIVGFGWTNGVFLVLLRELPQDSVTRLAKEQSGKGGSGR
ncbi:MAG TPA: trehalase family glycosidase [Candidatus Saccharimonadales bacterium]|nr:trehalase family glycosidase [Candidatus Saccharimonadales bacterium]